MYATWQQNITGLGRDSISSVSLIQGLAGPDVTSDTNSQHRGNIEATQSQHRGNIEAT